MGIEKEKGKFINTIGRLAKKDWEERQICPPSLVTAIVMEGTCFGRTLKAFKGGELFPYRRDGKKEAGKSYRQQIISHNNYLAGWREFGQSSPNWEKLEGQRNYILAVQYLQDARYPYYANKNYAAALVGIIEKYGLDKLDGENLP